MPGRTREDLAAYTEDDECATTVDESDGLRTALKSFNGHETDIDLSNMRISDDAFIKIFLRVFIASPHWEILDLSENFIGDRSMQELSTLAGRWHHQALREMYLDGNLFTDDGVILLVSVLPVACPSLKKLSLCPERLRDRAVERIVEKLTQTSIDTFLLVDTLMTTRGASILAEGLQHWRSLRELDVNTSRQGARALLMGMRKSFLVHLSIGTEDDFNMDLFDKEAERVARLIRNEFLIMVAMCGPSTVVRMGRTSFLKLLPTDVLHKLARMLYTLTDLEELM
jgi:Ran GTPase-activating protein (RanGAP) involved in mRNA processing and transport